jgi:hypothetical protein
MELPLGFPITSRLGEVKGDVTLCPLEFRCSGRCPKVKTQITNSFENPPLPKIDYSVILINVAKFRTAFQQRHMARGGYGLPRMSPRPAMSFLYMPCRQTTPETALHPFLGWLIRSGGGLRSCSTPLDTQRRTPMPLRRSAGINGRKIKKRNRNLFTLRRGRKQGRLDQNRDQHLKI